MENLSSSNIIILNDHTLYAEGLKKIIENLIPNCEINIANNVDKATSILYERKVNLLFLDIILLKDIIFEFISALKSKFKDLNIIILSSIEEIHIIKKLYGYGVDGILNKTASLKELELAIEKVNEGVKYLSSDLNSRLAQTMYVSEQTNLTKKEQEIFKSMIELHSVKLCAENLNLSESTIKNHRRNIMSKLKIHSVAELVKFAYENKIV